MSLHPGNGGGRRRDSPADPAQAQWGAAHHHAEPDIQKDFADRGVIPVVSPPPEELQGYVRSEIVRWARWWSRPAPPARNRSAGGAVIPWQRSEMRN
jgi:hypothetical protein